MEEAGIVISLDDMDIVGVMHRKSEDERVDFFLAAKSWQGDLTNMEPDICDDLSWYDIDNFPDNIIPYVKKAIENYITGIQFDIWGWQEE